MLLLLFSSEQFLNFIYQRWVTASRNQSFIQNRDSIPNAIRFLLFILFQSHSWFALRFRSELLTKSELVFLEVSDQIDQLDSAEWIFNLSYWRGNRIIRDYFTVHLCNHYGTLLLYEYLSGSTKRDWTCFRNCELYCISIYLCISGGFGYEYQRSMVGCRLGIPYAAIFPLGQRSHRICSSRDLSLNEKIIPIKWKIIESMLVFRDGQGCYCFCFMFTDIGGERRLHQNNGIDRSDVHHHTRLIFSENIREMYWNGR